MGYVKGRRTVLADAAGDDLSIHDDRIDVKNTALDKSFDEKLRRVIAPGVAAIEIGKHVPNLFGAVAFANAKGRHLVPRFYDPRSRNARKKRVNVVRMKRTGEFRAWDT